MILVEIGLNSKVLLIMNNITFIGIGAPRSGTSWIANVLRTHPQICISEPKEVRYFNRHEVQAGKLKGKINPNFDQDLSWYMRRFSHAKPGQLLGEISPVYLSDNEAPEAIKANFPDIKLIVCLRNPVDRAFSLYNLHRGNSLIDDISFETALEQERVYVETGMYAEHLERYLQHFNRNQILLLIFEEFIANPDKGFAQIHDFLGVDTNVNNDFSSFDTNASAKRRSTKLHKFAFRLSQWLINVRLSVVLTTLRSIGAHKLFRSINAAPAKQDKVSDLTRKNLTEMFHEDIIKLETMFNKDIRRWWDF